MRNWVIWYESWEGINAETKEEALRKFYEEEGHGGITGDGAKVTRIG